jgi:hypothetical protein
MVRTALEETMPVTRGQISTWRRNWLAGTCILGLTAFAGCSSGGRTFPTGEVSGKVTFKGEPISLGKITFITTGPTGDFGTGIINDGVYTLDAPLGLCKVEIQMQTDENKYAVPPQQMKMVKAKMKAMKDQGMKVPDDLPVTKKSTFTLPDKYKMADKSGLTLDVKDGKQTMDWDLR